jgi:hypothetical protein
VSGTNDKGGIGVFGKGSPAGSFEGDVIVTGDILLTNADCAEEFWLADCAAEPGTVMVLDDAARLRVATNEYDPRVAGIISGAGTYRPALTLDHQTYEAEQRCAIALMGKTFCKVDAGRAPINVGDLLTSSATPGHAMKARDPFRAFGAVIGKALQAVPSGRSLIPVLVALR